MITPTVGRIVLFVPNEVDIMARLDKDQPCAARVAYVWNDRLVNLEVVDHNGLTHVRPSARLLQDDDVPFEGEAYAQWMPYQRAEAAADKASKDAEALSARELAVSRIAFEPINDVKLYLKSVDALANYIQTGHQPA